MARVVGITLLDDKPIGFALTQIYGIGWSASTEILKISKIDAAKRVKSLSEDEIKRIGEIIEKNYEVEGDLKEEVSGYIKRLKDIGSYRGIRHIRNLPVHGQRTKSNARTKRGKRKTVGALKKEDMVKLQDAAKK